MHRSRTAGYARPRRPGRARRRPAGTRARGVASRSSLGLRERHRGRRRLAAVVELEERLRLEAEEPRHDAVGERLDADVEIAHSAVVVAARHLQLVLDLGHLLLQVEEILVGLELGIAFRQGKEASERRIQALLGGGLPVHIVGRDAPGALGSHVLEHAALVRGIGFHRLHQIGHEIGAALQLHVDPAPALAHHVALAGETVEHHDGIERDSGENGEDDPCHNLIEASLAVAARRAATTLPLSRSPKLVGDFDSSDAAATPCRSITEQARASVAVESVP